LRLKKPELVAGLFFPVILFAVPFSIRCYWALCLAPVPFLIPDELWYPQLARLYVFGLASGDLSVFKVNAVHPPLSRLFTWLFMSLLGPFGFSDIHALRFQSCLFSALTCVLVYSIVRSSFSRSAALFAWALLTLDPLSIIFSIASLDVVSLFFAVLSFYILLRTRQDSIRKCFFSGIFLGLAALSKYFAYPIVLFAISLIMISRRYHFKFIVSRVLLLAMSSAVILVVGNPLLWPPQITGFSGFDAFMEDSRHALYATDRGFEIITPLDWLGKVLKAQYGSLKIFYLSMFSHGMLVYPLSIFQNSYLPWLFLASLFLSAKLRSKLERLKLDSLLWFSASFLFFWMVVKSQIVPYYSVWLQPPLAVFLAVFIVDYWREAR